MIQPCQRVLVARLCTNIASRTAMIAAATHRPGWRTGTARIVSGRARCACAVACSLTCSLTQSSARGAVDHGIGDRAVLDAPLAEDLRVGAVRNQNLERGEDRVGHPVALRDRDAVGRGA